MATEEHVKTLERLAFGIEQYPDELKLRRLMSKDAVAIRAVLEENKRIRDLVRRLAAALYTDCPASVWKKLKAEALRGEK